MGPGAWGKGNRVGLQWEPGLPIRPRSPGKAPTQALAKEPLGGMSACLCCRRAADTQTGAISGW